MTLAGKIAGAAAPATAGGNGGESKKPKIGTGSQGSMAWLRPEISRQLSSRTTANGLATIKAFRSILRGSSTTARTRAAAAPRQQVDAGQLRQASRRAADIARASGISLGSDSAAAAAGRSYSPQISRPAAKNALDLLLNHNERMPALPDQSADPAKQQKDPSQVKNRNSRMMNMELMTIQQRGLSEMAANEQKGIVFTHPEMLALEEYASDPGQVKAALESGQPPRRRQVGETVRNLHSALEKLPDTRLNAYRGIHTSTERADRLLERVLAGGKQRVLLQASGYMSSSATMDPALDHAQGQRNSRDRAQVYCQIRGRTGKNISMIQHAFDRGGGARLNLDHGSGKPAIGEVLFRPGSQFVVLAGGKHPSENRYGFVLQEVPAGRSAGAGSVFDAGRLSEINPSRQQPAAP